MNLRTLIMIIKSFVIIEENGHFLLIREAAKKWKGKWFLPGGKVDVGELPADAARRETREEAGYDINIKGIAYIRYEEKLFRKQLCLFYSAAISGGNLKSNSDKHSLEARWFSFPQIRSLQVRRNLREILIRYKSGETMPADNFIFS